jgi:hypothetical protein
MPGHGGVWGTPGGPALALSVVASCTNSHRRNDSGLLNSPLAAPHCSAAGAERAAREDLLCQRSQPRGASAPDSTCPLVGNAARVRVEHLQLAHEAQRRLLEEESLRACKA